MQRDLHLEGDALDSCCVLWCRFLAELDIGNTVRKGEVTSAKPGPQRAEADHRPAEEGSRVLPNVTLPSST